MSSPSIPPPAAPTAAPPPPPTAVDPAVLAARQNARDRAAQAGGRDSTIVTGSLPDADAAGKKVLGA